MIGIFVLLVKVELNGTLWKNKNWQPGSKWVLEAICSHWSHLSDQYSAAGFKSNMTATDLWVKQNRTSAAGVGHRMKGPRKRERKGFSSHEDTQDVSLLTFAWLVFFVHQPPTNTPIVWVSLCSHSGMLQYQLIYDKCHRLIGNLLLLCAPKKPQLHSNNVAKQFFELLDKSWIYE